MAGSHQDVHRRQVAGSTFDICADRTRWQLLRVLRSHAGWLTEGRLAAKLVAANPGTDGEADGRGLRVKLRHAHLPKLSDRDLLAWNEGEGVVRRTETTAAVVDRFADVMELVADTADLSASLLADERRREVLALLGAEPGPLTRTQVAQAIATGADRQSAGDVSIALHHNHLPKLEDAGLVEYDSEAETVAYSGPPELPAALPER